MILAPLIICTAPLLLILAMMGRETLLNMITHCRTADPRKRKRKRGHGWAI